VFRDLDFIATTSITRVITTAQPSYVASSAPPIAPSEAKLLSNMEILNRRSDKPMSSISIFKDAYTQPEKENNRIVKTPRITVLHRTSLAL
jgi:hypothetical protein